LRGLGHWKKKMNPLVGGGLAEGAFKVVCEKRGMGRHGIRRRATKTTGVK